MVKLTKIYTRVGDDGKTSLVGGRRCAKHEPRVIAYGTVDEANAAVGVSRLHVSAAGDAMLARIQHDLFDLGADLSTPQDSAKDAGALRITAAQVERLEREIDALNAGLAPLDSFVLPGGSAASAYLHVARTIARRAERLIFALAEQEEVNTEACKYINRLSDHLFVLARHENDQGARDVLWQPGANR